MDRKNELIKVITEVENVVFIDFVYKFVMRLKRNWGVKYGRIKKNNY